MSGVVVTDPVNDLIDALSEGLVLNEDGVYMGEDAGILIREALATAEQNAMPRWIACSERMPLTGLTVLVAGGCAFFDGITWRTMTGTASGREIEWHVTHWMPLPKDPLPEPPKEPSR